MNYKLRIFLGFLFLCIFCIMPNLKAQLGGVMGNEWIQKEQTYRKIEVAEDGIYRITASQLGIPSTINPHNIHLYFLGEEQPLYIHNSGDPSRFEADDYIEFWGQRHDARTEQPLYRHPTRHTGGENLQPNPYFNTMSDTSAYFITWNNTPRGNEYTYGLYTYHEDSLNKLPIRPHFRHSEVWFGRLGFPSWYSLGGRIPQYDSHREGNCSYTTGEGYVHRPFPSYGVPNFTYRFPTKYPSSEYTDKPKIISYLHPFAPAATQNVNIAYGNKKFTVPIGADTMSLIQNNIEFEDLDTINHHLLVISSQLPNFQVDLGYAKIEYDRRFQFDNQNYIPMQWKAENEQNCKIVVSGLNADETEIYYLYDLNLKFKIIGTHQSGKVLFPIKGFQGKRKFILVSGKRIQSDYVKIKIFNGSDIKNYSQYKGAEFVIIAHPGVIQSAQKYASYRDTCSVNQLSSLAVLTEELYDEFSYGSPNVMAIKRFIRTALDHWEVKPKYIFLWGKGWYARLGNELKTPTWGSPASDNRFVCQFNEDATLNYLPEIPIGRVNVMNDEQGYAYLEKIKEYEHTPYQEWMKYALHLGGGEGASEQRGIIQNLNLVKNIFESAPLGGKVTYFQKGNIPGAPVQPQSTSIKEVIKNGVSVFCFYGHSSPGLFDVEVLDPAEYSNYGKYPFVIANGCYAGDFNNANTLGEKFLTEPRKGAIGWLSSSSYGYATQLSRYNQLFYEVAFRDSLGHPIGDIVKETARRFLLHPNLTQNDYVHVSQVNLQCDPSIRLYHPSGPDLEILRSDIKITPNQPTMETRTIEAIIRLRNIGTTFQDSFLVSVKHFTPDGDVKYISIPSVKPVLRIDTLRLKIDLPFPPIGGIHRFEILLDSDNRITEMNENNNRYSAEVIIPTDLPQILYPTPYMITNRQLIYLSAAAPGKGGNNEVFYRFEADTTPDFNSSLLVQSPVIKGIADLGQWELPIRLRNNTVYFWRVCLDDKSLWATSSFKYIANKTGWAQSHKNQWMENVNYSENIYYDTLTHKWAFESFSVDITARAGQNVEFNIDGGVNGYTNINATYQNRSVLFSIIDGKSLQAKTYTQQYNYLDFVHYSNISKLEDIIDSMNDGDYIILLGHQPYTLHWKWDSTSMMKTLNAIGADQKLLEADDDDGFIVLGRKGAERNSALTIVKQRNVGADSGAFLSTKLYSTLAKGKIKSPWFGRAKSKWFSADHQFLPDNQTINIIGKDAEGKEHYIKSSKNHTIDLNEVSSDQYPFLRLEAELSDTINRLAPQPNYWHVYYDELPEGIMIPQPIAVNPIEIVQAGDTLRYTCHFKNITPIRMDSLSIQCEIEDINGRVVFFEHQSLGSIPEWGQISFTFKHDTRKMNGYHRLVLTANPNYLRPEKSIENNRCIHLFTVVPDLRPPVMEIIIEKKRPTNGMIVSPNPEIVIRLKDDNKFEIPNDTTAVEVKFGLFGSRENIKRIVYSNNILKLVSQEPDGVIVAFNPQNLEDGRYELQVQGWDKARNPVNILPYTIQLEVKNITHVSEVVNIPNPFSDKTYFSYLLTGKQLPTEFKIEIFDLSGRKIRTIDLIENNDVHFGSNITKTTWDGTDDYGKSLAEGIYIYQARVTFSQGNKLFKKQGKIILAR